MNTFSPTNVSKYHLHVELPPENIFSTLAEDPRLPGRQTNLTEAGQKIETKRETKDFGMGTCTLGKGAIKRGGFYTLENSTQVGSVEVSELQREVQNSETSAPKAMHRKFSTEIAPNGTFQLRSGSHAHVRPQQEGPGC